MRIGGAHNPFPLRVALSALLTGIILLLLLAYVIYQARFLLLGPQIALSTDPSTVQHERAVTLEGQVFNIVKASLNGRPIFTDENGNFSEALILENGYTIATLRAEDRYGRTATIQKSFVFIPQSVAHNQ